MKRILFSFLLFIPNQIIQASSPVDQAHLQLQQYLKNKLDQENRVKAMRTLALTRAAEQLQAGINREHFKKIRTELAQGILPSPANEPILQEMHKITQNHSRQFPFCFKPWVFQRTINREAESLHNVIDNILKTENPDLYEKIKAGNNPMATLGSDCAIAYSVPVIASAPPLQQILLDPSQQKRN